MSRALTAQAKASGYKQRLQTAAKADSVRYGPANAKGFIADSFFLRGLRHVDELPGRRPGAAAQSRGLAGVARRGFADGRLRLFRAVEAFAAQTNLAIFGIDAQDFHFNFITDLHHIVGAVNLLRC